MCSNVCLIGEVEWMLKSYPLEDLESTVSQWGDHWAKAVISEILSTPKDPGVYFRLVSSVSLMKTDFFYDAENGF